MQQQRGGQPRGAALFFLAVAITIVIAVATVAAVRRLRARFTTVAVSGASMSPTLHDGDYLVVDCDAYRDTPPAVGDIVLVEDPRVPGRELLKRIAQADDERGYWVLGDNPSASTDSRTFGWVSPDAILGRVTLRYWPGRPVRSSGF